MGRERKPYTLIQREMSNGKKIWYYRTYDQFGKRTSAKTTHQTSKTKADKYCMELFKEEMLIPDSSQTVSMYVQRKKIFQWGECIYCIENSVGQTYADDCLSRMKQHIIPILGDLKFTSLTSKTIDAWQTRLLTNKDKSLSVKTVRECKTVLRIILNSARSDGFLSRDPFDGVKKLPRHQRKVLGILTIGEVLDLFDPKNYQNYWKNHKLYYTANFVACFTGMRQGEIRALTPDKIFDKHIYVNKSWGKNGLGPPKTGETRKVYMTPEVKQAIMNIMPEHGYIFSRDQKKPMSGNRILDSLYRALNQMGISDQLIRERNIKFHSYRHWLVTYLRSNGVSDPEITTITGQKTPQIIDDYTRFNMIDNANVISALDNITGNQEQMLSLR
ncbi:MAG: tyrosine-type recombinase/integrase [Spirochaetaceae bacterium]|jgi:integrase|nr:tyrosine-type recombinase/integrase [Spirochaetaceae bacterium]